MKNMVSEKYLEDEINRREAVEKDLNFRLRQQEAIANLGEFALNSGDLDSIFNEAVQIVSNTLSMEMCKILERLPGNERLLLRAGVGWKEGLVGNFTVGAKEQSQAGFTLLANEPVIVGDLAAESRFIDTDMLADHHVVSGMSVVIPGRGGQPFGVLGAHTAQPRVLLAHDTRFLQAVASILASAIERIRVEDELRRSRDELAIILHGIQEGVTVQTRDGKIVYANRSAAAILGFPSAEDVLAAPMADVMRKFVMLDDEGHPLPIEKLPGRMVLQGAPRASTRVRFRVVETGEERWSIVDATPIHDAAGNIIQTVNIFRDITEFTISEKSQKFLAEAGALLASSLDYKTTLANVAHLAVTNLADWCSVYLTTDEKDTLRITATHKDPAKVELARKYQEQYSPHIRPDSGIGKVLLTGQPEYYPQITDEMLEAAAEDDAHLAMMRELGMKSAIVVPLNVRDQTMGAIVFIWADSDRKYSQWEVDLANELARRAALAIENARLFAEVQSVNARLEQRVSARTKALKESYQKLEKEVVERKKTEEALQKSEEFLKQLFESAPDAMILMDLTGKIIRVNERTEDLFQYKRGELVGSHISRLLPLGNHQAYYQARSGAMEDWMRRAGGSGMELSAARKGGEAVPVDIVLSPVRIDQDEMMLCAVRNITEQKRLQAELAETHRRLFESVEAERLFISQEIHDGPMQDLYAVSMSLDALEEELPVDVKASDLSTARDSIQNIIQSLREICGELRPPTLTHFGLEKAIRSHLTKIQEAHPEIAIQVNLMRDGSSLPERVRLALYRVYQSSISNIIRHAEAKKITIDFSMVDGYLQFSIQDDGKGFRLPGKWISLVREGHFGLAGMAERIEAIGGRFMIESEVGKGTLVKVILPVEQPDPTSVSMME